MENILAHAQQLVYTLMSLMPSVYQRQNLEAMLGLFLEANGKPLPEHSQNKSASALSRFLNVYAWSTRSCIRQTREQVLQQMLRQCPQGKRPFLQVIIDLTTLEKCGKFKSFGHLIKVYNGKRGLHLVVMYLVVGKWRVPWNFRVWRGKGTPSPARLGIKLVKTLPKSLTKRFRVVILADTAFGSVEFLHAMRQLKYHAITGLSSGRKLSDYQVLLKVNRRQLRCTKCQKVVSEELSFIKTRRTYTKRLAMKVIKEVLETNVESAARRNRMTASEVETLLKEQEVDLVKEKPKHLKKLGIDEITQLKGGKNYAAVLVDLETRKPIALLEKRNKEVIAEYLSSLGLE